MKNTYLIYTLSAKSIIDHCYYGRENPDRIEIDLNDKFTYNQVVSSLGRHTDCPYFYQLRKCKGVTDNLKDSLVFMDFTGIFGYENADSQICYQEVVEKMLFENSEKKLGGLYIRFPDSKPIRFVPMDKSASMAKSCRICFIDADCCEEMNKRLMLDMELHEEVSLNKLYAYRGLYLSDARRVEDKDLVLNENTVLIIDDACEGRNALVISATKAAETQNGYTNWDIGAPQQETVNVNMFDGEGLISFDYANKLRKALGIDAYSFQIRLPFGKGMLHTVAFHDILKEALDITHLEGVTITDAFGIPRRLCQVQIVLTKSQFKCFAWLNTYAKQEKIQDPVAYYFARFKKYQYALYVANADSMLQNGQKKVTLNYQFLNPMKLQAPDDAFLKNLVNNHFAYADKLRLNKYYQKENALAGQSDNSFIDSEDTCLLKKAETWLQVLQENSSVIHERKIKGKLAGMYESRLRDTALGRLSVEGEIRFLTRDLAALCWHMAKQCQNADRAALNAYFSDKTLKGEHFSLPGRKITLGVKENVALLRNPHLSRNEEWLCTYFENPWRKAHLGHLRGILEISYYTVGNLALGGADFDGDLVKCVKDPIIVKAVQEGCYTDGVRTLPVVQIPSPPPPRKKPVNGYKMDYQTIRDTFSSRVGEISNAAITVGYWEYCRGLEEAENLSPKATILTGLEIDSAKTGNKPYISDITRFDARKEEKAFNYIQAKNALEKMDPVKIRSTAVNVGQESVRYEISTGRYDVIDVPNMANDSKKAFAEIDKLFWLYGERKATPKTAKAEGEKPAARKPLLEKMPEGAEETRQKTAQIIEAYCNVLSRASADYRAKRLYENARYKASIDDILMLQYDSLADELCGSRISDLRNEILAALCEATRKKYTEIAKAEMKASRQEKELAEVMLGWIVTDNWQFMNREKRREALNNAELGLKKEHIDLLTNFDCDGYRLLYYFMKDAVAAVLAGEGDIENERHLPGNQQNAYTEKYLHIYLEGKAKKQTGAVWKKVLTEAAREDIEKAVRGEQGKAEETVSHAIRYVYEQRSKADRNGDFFWEVFTAQEILQTLNAQMQKQEDTANA